MKSNIIGKVATVVESKNKNLLGITGTVSDETKNTLVINNKIIIKEQVKIKVNGTVTTIPSKNTSERIKVKK